MAKRAAKPADYSEAELRAASDPFSDTAISDLLKFENETGFRLKSRESAGLEYKQSFNMAALTQYARTMSAFANARGGYIVFGVGNSPRDLIGLANSAFDELDPKDITDGLNKLFSPEIQWRPHTVELRGRKLGLLYVFPSATKPVIAIADGGKKPEVKEAEIYYRYSGRTEKIRYSELRQILDDQRRRELDIWLKHLARITQVGVENAAIMDVVGGEVVGSSGRSFVIDESLLPRLRYIREGHFVDTGGDPTLRLVGDLQALPEGLIQPEKIVPVPTTIRTKEIVEAFLDQDTTVDPKVYIGQICHEPSAFLPIYFFADKAHLDIDGTKQVVSAAVSRSQSQTKLLERLNKTNENFWQVFPSKNAQQNEKKQEIYSAVASGTLGYDFEDDDLNIVLQSIRSLTLNDLNINYVLALLRHIFGKYYASTTKGPLVDAIRRAICHIDCLLYQEAVRQR